MLLKNFLLFVFCFTIYMCDAQISALRDGGVLVVRLESGNNKIKAIEQRMADSDDLSYWNQELEAFKTSLNEKNIAIKNAFDAKYDFSDILYIYDNASVALKNGVRSGIFLDDQLAVAEDINLEDRFFLLATEERSESGAEGIYILNSSLEPLERPLPYFIKLNSIGFLFRKLFSSGNAMEKMYTKAVEKLNMKFYKHIGISI